jgi:hypothetical protein
VNYWRAISQKLVDEDNTASVIFKTNGLLLFHSASPAIFVHLANIKRFKVEDIEQLLKRAFENLPTEYVGVSSPAFWKRGSTASGLNAAAVRKYAAAIAAGVNANVGGGEGISV